MRETESLREVINAAKDGARAANSRRLYKTGLRPPALDQRTTNQ